jgi:UDPglucose--hexose-1-phosphate uridylyltransferase
MPISFRRAGKTVEVLAADGTSVQYELEYRWDPLTSRVAVICPHLREKWTEYYSVRDEEWLRSLVEASQAGCPFCHPTINKVAARFAPEQLDEEQIRVDEVIAFPNLYPRTDFEAVITSPEVHYLRLNEFTPELLARFLTAALDCIKQAYRKNDKLLYPVIGGNYLPPAGASLLHYHMQLSMQEYPFESVRTLIEASMRYEQHEHANFWLDLMRENQDREIARTNNVYWYVPFAPTGFCEVRALITKPNFVSVSAKEVQELAEGLSAVLNYYNDHGFAAFNFTLYSDRLDADRTASGIPPGLQIVARPNPRPNYLSIDSWYMPLLLQQAIVLERPEELARDVKPFITAALAIWR